MAVVPVSAGDGGPYDLQAETVLYHEYAHHFMLQYYPAGYPAWYVEGFAEFFSTTRFPPDGSADIGLPATHRFSSFALLPAFPMARFFAEDVGRMSADETSSFYAYAWALTHYLHTTKSLSEPFANYLRAFSKGEPPAEAAEKAFGDFKQLDRELQRYIHQSKMTYQKWKVGDFGKPQIVVDPLNDAQDMLLPLYIRYSRGSKSPEDVAGFVREARAAAAKAPAEPMAYELLAEGELDADQFDAASAANDRLLALKPGDARALLRAGRIAVARKMAGDDGPAWQEVRRLIVKANRADPYDPFPLFEYYRSFGAEGVAPPQLAIDGLARALELAPQAAGARFALANVRIREGKPDLARRILQPILNDPHSAERRAEARKLLDTAPHGPPTIDAKAVDQGTNRLVGALSRPWFNQEISTWRPRRTKD